MTGLILTIGNKNLSTWSLRPWLLMKHAEIPFTEKNIVLDQPDSKEILSKLSPHGLVPFLQHGDVTIWDSLAIAEYVNELFPDKQLWPEAMDARGVARSVCAEMHSGFSALRTVWPMNFTRENMRHLTTGGVAKDIARIDEIWSHCRRTYGAGGDYLFGAFSIADAFYAPVVSRFSTYGPVKLSAESAAYMETIRALPAMQEWGDGALQEIGG